MRSSDFRSAPTWIAGRLGLKVATVQAALDRLKRLGVVRQDRSGWLSTAKPRFRTSDDITNSSIQRAHHQYLDKAREALDKLPVTQRDFTSLMLTLAPEQLPRAKEMIRKFQDDFMAELEPSPRPEVFQLCIQLFPLTSIAEKKA